MQPFSDDLGHFFLLLIELFYVLCGFRFEGK